MKLKKDRLEIVFDFLTMIVVLGSSVYLATNWSIIPDEVPLHYDFAGNADRFGSKTGLLILPALEWIFFIAIYLLRRKPELWNTGVKVTEENKERIYAILARFISSCQLIVVSVFAVMTVLMVRGRPLGPGFTVFFLSLCFGNILFWIIKLIKNK